MPRTGRGRGWGVRLRLDLGRRPGGVSPAASSREARELFSLGLLLLLVVVVLLRYDVLLVDLLSRRAAVAVAQAAPSPSPSSSFSFSSFSSVRYFRLRGAGVGVGVGGGGGNSGDPRETVVVAGSRGPPPDDLARRARDREAPPARPPGGRARQLLPSPVAATPEQLRAPRPAGHPQAELPEDQVAPLEVADGHLSGEPVGPVRACVGVLGSSSSSSGGGGGGGCFFFPPTVHVPSLVSRRLRRRNITGFGVRGISYAEDKWAERGLG